MSAALLVPSVAFAVAPSDAIRFLNAERAMHGLPADVVENPAWSNGCLRHAAYYKLNGLGQNPHDEDPSKPGYTPEGQEAARSSVLGGGFTDSGQNGWAGAPIHYMQMMAPALTVTGYGDGGWACLWTWPGFGRPAPASTEIYSIPGEGTEVDASLEASELPFTPGEKVGLPAGTVTGPHLYVFGFGPGPAYLVGGYGQYSVTAASLTGPGGPVEVRIVNNDVLGGGYIPPGGIVIPVKPLLAGSTYTATATIVDQNGVPTSRTWGFRTKPAAPAARPPLPGTGFSDDELGDGASGQRSRIERLRATRRAVSGTVRPAGVRVKLEVTRKGRKVVSRSVPTGKRSGTFLVRVTLRKGDHVQSRILKTSLPAGYLGDREALTVR